MERVNQKKKKKKTGQKFEDKKEIKNKNNVQKYLTIEKRPKIVKKWLTTLKQLTVEIYVISGKVIKK